MTDNGVQSGLISSFSVGSQVHTKHSIFPYDISFRVARDQIKGFTCCNLRLFL